MPIVEITKEDLEYPILPAGTFGPGLDNEADITVNRFEYPAVDNLPGWHKEGDTRRYAFFEFTVKLSDGGFFTLPSFVELGKGPKFAKWLEALGVDMAPTDSGGVAFEIDDVAGRKVKGLVMGDPRTGNDGTVWQGNVNQIIG